MSDTQFGKIKTNYIVTKYKGMPENKPIETKVNITQLNYTMIWIKFYSK